MSTKQIVRTSSRIGAARQRSMGRPEFQYDVAIVGLGYVGLPTALAFHSGGKRVVGVDISADRISAIRRRDVDLLDSDQKRLIDALEGMNVLEMSTSMETVGRAAAVIVCVPTPVDSHLIPDLTSLASACASVVEFATPGQTVVLTSTTYVGCTRELLVEPLEARGLRVGSEVFVSFAPERIDPGNENIPHHEVPRVVGGYSTRCCDKAVEVLAPCTGRAHPVRTLEAAELTKLYENTFRAVNISLVNEFADVSRLLEVDISEVIEAASTKPFGFLPFKPGAGVGGHCIPCDPHYLLWQLRKQRGSAPIIEVAMGAIARRPQVVCNRAAEVLARAGRSLVDARILVHGVAYKANIADIRESPALEIITRLKQEGASVSYFDSRVPSIRLGAQSLQSVANPAALSWDLVILHTMHGDDPRDWLGQHPRVLDAAFKLADSPGTHKL